MGATQCSGLAPKFNWDPDLFAGDSKAQLIIGDSGTIKTSDPEFDEYICMRNDEPGKALEAYYEVIDQCEVWKPKAKVFDQEY